MKIITTGHVKHRKSNKKKKESSETKNEEDGK
jgi:hypothetical protein